MSVYKASIKTRKRTIRVLLAAATLAVGAAAVFGRAPSQLTEAADNAIGIIKTVAYISAGRIPPSEPIPNSNDEIEGNVPSSQNGGQLSQPSQVPPSGVKSYIFEDIESSDEGSFTELRETADIRPPENSDTETAEDSEVLSSEHSIDGLLIRRNILDFDDELDYGAAGTQSGMTVRYTYEATQDPTFITLESGAQVRNCTYVTNDDLAAESVLLPELKITLNSEPQVLIMHTHTTESYEPYERSYYDADFPFRSRDSRHNVIAVGAVIAEKLAAAGIGVIHDGTIHDYPSYNGAYNRSEQTVKEYLEKYPSIKVVLDVHRDALESSDGARIAPVAEINGKKAAQIMIISGCDNGSFGMPDYMMNFRLACLFQNEFAEYDGLTRAVLFDYRKYNQHLTTGSLLLEVGSHANSLEEALYCGSLAGEGIARALLSLAEE